MCYVEFAARTARKRPPGFSSHLTDIPHVPEHQEILLHASQQDPRRNIIVCDDSDTADGDCRRRTPIAKKPRRQGSGPRAPY